MKVVIEQLCKSYDRKTNAVDNLSLELQTGMFGLLGPNGAGKTTLMKILATLLEPTSGRIELDGLIYGRDQREIRRRLGYLPQTYGLYGYLTPRELLDYMASLSGLPGGQQRKNLIDRMLEQVNLLPHANQRVSGFSGGMKQRLGIAQAILHQPDFLIVDEPTAGLDPIERIRFRNLLQAISGERIVILSTHIVSDISSSCADMALIKNGKINYRGTPSEFIQQARGKVWQIVVPPEKLYDYQSAFRIVSTVRKADGMALRLLSDESQVEGLPGLRAEEPTLEDAYLWANEQETQDLVA